MGSNMDWQVFWTAFFGSLVAALPGLLAAVAAFVQSRKNTEKLELVHQQTNSLKDELVSEVRTASIAKGRLDEREATERKQSDL